MPITKFEEQINCLRKLALENISITKALTSFKNKIFSIISSNAKELSDKVESEVGSAKKVSEDAIKNAKVAYYKGIDKLGDIKDFITDPDLLNELKGELSEKLNEVLADTEFDVCKSISEFKEVVTDEVEKSVDAAIIVDSGILDSTLAAHKSNTKVVTDAVNEAVEAANEVVGE